MRRVKVLALAIMGVCVLSVAITASASAHLFHASKTGLLLGIQTGNQEFKTSAFGSVICKKSLTHGVISELLALHQLVTTSYEECTAFGAPAEVSPAQYLFNADGGLVKLENLIVITVKSLGCFVHVPAGQHFKEAVVYDNQPSAGAILELSNVKGIESTSSGGLCGPNSKEGTYTGNNLITEDGGFLSWL